MIATERPLTDAEMPLVLDSWIKSFRSSPWSGCLPNNVATTILRGCIVDLLNAGATLRGLFDASGQCVAWVCEDLDGDVPVVHFAYVKRCVPASEMANVRNALAPVGGIYTYKTPWLQQFLGPEFAHRPAFARNRSKPADRG